MCRRKRSYVTKLLTTVFVLLALEVSSQTVDKTVEYRDVLKSRVGEIQTDITQVNSDRTYTRFDCDHYPVYTGDSIKIVIFVWASEGETHAMRSCLYQGIMQTRKQIIQMLQSPNQSHTFIPDLSVKFCNKSLTSGILNVRRLSGQEMNNKTRVIALSFYVIEPQIDGLVEEREAMRYHESGIPTITSSIYARPLRKQSCADVRLQFYPTNNERNRKITATILFCCWNFSRNDYQVESKWEYQCTSIFRCSGSKCLATRFAK